VDPLAGAARGFNVIVVTFDTVRTDAIGCYGDPRARTPNVDALAKQGARFTRAISPAPVTLPSHSTLFTGLDPLAHGVHNNGTFVLAPEHRTLAEELAAHGYRTGAVIGAFVLDSRYGLAQGFENYEDDLQKDALPAASGHFSERSATRVTDHALEWLGAQPREPFFLWTHYFDPHAPYNAPLEHLQGERLPADGPYDEQATRREYLAEVTYADHELGRLLAELPADVRERTLVVFTADHGESLG
jgi:arylsulfatase A-like enzyme